VNINIPIMTQNIGVPNPVSGLSGAGGNQQPSSVDGTLFRALVALKLSSGNAPASSTTAAPSAASAAQTASSIVGNLIGNGVQMNGSTAQQLTNRISSLLQNGVSVAQIVSTLSSALAQQIGTALGTTDANSLAALQAEFANALSPPGTAPPDAAELAERIRHVAWIASTALGNSMGQQNRNLGNVLDADTAGGNPAPNQTPATANVNAPGGSQGSALSMQSILQDALGALNGPIAPPTSSAQSTATTAQTLSTAQLPPQTPTPVTNAQSATATTAQTSSNNPPANPAGSGVSAPPSTESLVAASSLDAAGTGGGTLLGRTLTRAANAAASLGPNPVAAATSAPSTTAALRQALAADADADTDANTNPQGEGTSTSGQTAAATVAADAAPAAPNASVAAFLQNFQRALAAAAQADGDDTSLGTQTQTNGATTIASDGSSAGQAQSFLTSLGAVQNAQTSTTLPDGTQSTQTSPSTSTTDPNDVVAQLLRGITMRDLGQTSEIRLRLVPESLGDLSVKLAVNNNGSVSASVVAQTPQARDALIANQAQLTRSLSDAGLKLTSFNVNLSNSGTNMFGQQQPQSQQQRFGFGRGLSLASDDASDDLSAMPSFAPPVLAGAGTGSLNYLV
jgi:hypothetical protein